MMVHLPFKFDNQAVQLPILGRPIFLRLQPLTCIYSSIYGILSIYNAMGIILRWKKDQIYAGQTTKSNFPTDAKHV